MKRVIAALCVLGLVTGCSTVKVQGPQVTTVPYTISVQFGGTIPVNALTLSNVPVPDGASYQAILSVAEVTLGVMLAKKMNWKSCVFTPIDAIRPVMGASIPGTFTVSEKVTCKLDGAPIVETLQISLAPQV